MFASADDLRLFLRRTSIDTEAAEQVLGMAADTIRAELGQQLDYVENDLFVAGPGTGRVLLLPELPVVEVSRVVEYGLDLVDGEGYTWSHAGTLTRLGGCWPVEPRAVTVTYSHGFAVDELPGVLRTVSVMLAGRAYVNPDRATQISIGDTSRSYGTGGKAPSGLLEPTDYERRLLRGLRS